MPQRLLRSLQYLLRWTLLSALTGALAGSASALLLASLDRATYLREAHPWLIALLPFAGFSVGLLYWRFGTAVESGNDLILDQIHAEAREEAIHPAHVIPLRMAPLILFGTVLTHLFGGSAGREGTALQAAASLADQLTKPFHLSTQNRRTLLMAAISAGFGSVFGTPFAGALFGMEVLTLGTIAFDATLPCLLSALLGDLTTRAWHIHHTAYHIMAAVPPLRLGEGLAAALAGIAFGLAALLFARLTHALGNIFRKHIPWPPLRPLLGGALVAMAVFASGTTRYIGLGIPTILAALAHPITPWAWLNKLLFTALTLGAGFKGGEVTPLFFIGSTLGNALAHILPLPASLLAAMGFVAVLAGAANTPTACYVLALELFGGRINAYALIACLFAYLSSGHTGIYRSQGIGRRKFAWLTRRLPFISSRPAKR